MGKQTYYMVQISSIMFVAKDERFGYGLCIGKEKAAHLSLAEAHGLYREYKAKRDTDTPRRFPRILKVTTEIKTITKNH